MSIDPNTTYAFDIRFNYGQKDVTLTFLHEQLAIAYQMKSPECQFWISPEGYHINLPPLDALDYIRSGRDHARELVFIFSDKQAARAWAEELPLVIRDGKEVRLKGKWNSGALMETLGMREEDFVEEETYNVVEKKTHDVPGHARGSGHRRPPKTKKNKKR